MASIEVSSGSNKPCFESSYCRPACMRATKCLILRCLECVERTSKKINLMGHVVMTWPNSDAQHHDYTISISFLAERSGGAVLNLNVVHFRSGELFIPSLLYPRLPQSMIQSCLTPLARRSSRYLRITTIPLARIPVDTPFLSSAS